MGIYPEGSGLCRDPTKNQNVRNHSGLLNKRFGLAVLGLKLHRYVIASVLRCLGQKEAGASPISMAFFVKGKDTLANCRHRLTFNVMGMAFFMTLPYISLVRIRYTVVALNLSSG